MPVAKETIEAKVPVLVKAAPDVAVFLKNDREFEAWLEATKSNFPSPSKSPKVTPCTLPVEPADISTFVAKLNVVPLVKVLRNNETVLPALAETTKSILPLPSISPAAMPLGDEGIPVMSCFVANELVLMVP